MSANNPCVTCGACCAYFRCSFYWAEADSRAGGSVPEDLTEKLTPFLVVMKGMNQPNPRCIALQGEIGSQVQCTIYESRSSVCREFHYSWANGERNERCDQARMAWGLPPLEPPSFVPEATSLPATVCEPSSNEPGNLAA